MKIKLSKKKKNHNFIRNYSDNDVEMQESTKPAANPQNPTGGDKMDVE